MCRTSFSDKAREQFGYAPIFSLKESIRLTVEGLKKRGYERQEQEQI
jgi:hypothetical protein